MRDFTVQLRVGQALLRFDFMVIYTVGGPRYYVTVGDTNQKVHLFQIQQKQGRWRIVDAPNVPDWIRHAEAELEKAIDESDSPPVQ